MRTPDLINYALKKINSLIEHARDLIIKFPNDNLMKLSLRQLESRHNLLINELENSLLKHKKHSIKYIFDENMDKISMNILIENLKNLGEIINKSIQHLNKKKYDSIPLYFNTVFNGSFGIQLSTEFVFDKLPFDSNYDKTFEFVIDVIDRLSNNTNVDNAIINKFEGNKALIHKYSNFFKTISDSQKNIKLQWASPNSKEKQISVKYTDAERVYNILKNHEKSDSEIIEFEGIIKGISLLKYDIEFVKKEKSKNIKAKFKKELTEKIISHLNKSVKIKFLVNKEFNETTEEEIKKYEIIEIIANYC